MKISQATLSILTNFVNINSGIIIEPGNTLRTLNSAVYAQATVRESFPVEAILPDLRNFLDVLSLFREPDFDFGADHVRIVESDGSGGSSYPYGQPGSVRPLPKKMNPLDPSKEISFSLSQKQWATLQKAFRGRALGKMRWGTAPQVLRIISNSQAVQISVGPRNNSDATQYTMPVDARTNSHECQMVFDTENLPLLGGDYAVTVRPVFTEFRQTKGPGMLYYVAAEPTWSSWGGKQEYRVIVTRSRSEDCTVLVQAHSPEEAERMVEAKPPEQFTWSEKPGYRMDFRTAIATAELDVPQGEIPIR
jgi:hypothetical protein